MKKRTRTGAISIFLIIGLMLISGSAHAKTDWNTLKEIELSGPVLDITGSPDGQKIFALTEKEIVVYSTAKQMIESRIPLKESFNRLIFDGRNKTLILSGGTSKMIKIIQVVEIFDVEVAGLPFKGPENAPVTIAVFDDYQ